jgi:Cu(I)/Ag(I) efflux system membrane fusion protein
MGKSKIFSNKYVKYLLLLTVGILIGRLLFHHPSENVTNSGKLTETSRSTIWTCSMHPQIRMSQPGKCPICGMELIPLSQSGTASVDPETIHMTREAVQLANVLTSVVSKQVPVKEIRLYGKVEADERMLQSQVAHIPGRIESLMVNFTGESVTRGQVLGRIYSPELITAQQELIETAKTKEVQPAIYDAAKEKLHQWKLSDDQISQTETSGKIQSTLDIISNTTGTVISRKVNTGDYISQGSVLFEIADLDKVWVMFEAYESDLQFVRKGDIVSFSLQALPGNNFSGRIIFIDPVIDPVTRVAKVRVEAQNRTGKLKPGMFATGVVSSAVEGYANSLIIPRSSVLWTGKRSIVYVKQKNSADPSFKMREIELGPMLGDSYIVQEGLKEGEEIVTQGAFSVDAASQLEGKPSMMNPNSGEGSVGRNQEISRKSQDMKDGPGIQFESLAVSGNCEMCKDRIETVAKSVKGVSSADWDMATKYLRLGYSRSVTSADAVLKVIAEAGHDNVKYRAPDDVYSKLPECCLYRGKINN